MYKNDSAKRLSEIARVFLKLGTIAFGGPAAHIAMMDDEIVKRRKWLDRDRFMDLVGASNLIPGPNSTELAIHLGFLRAGWPGLLVAGSCFILPAMAIVLIFAMVYSRYGALPQAEAVLYGIKPVIIAIVLQALWGLGKSSLKHPPAILAAIGAFSLVLLGWNEILLLLLAGILVMAIRNRSRFRSGISALAPFPLLPAIESKHALGLLAAAGTEITASMSASKLFFVFLKIGSVLYGSGYVLLAFLQSEFVDRYNALTSQQLLDAVAVGQFTPGPLFTTATFVGYLIQGVPGAILATIGIFLPAFLFVALTAPFIPKLRKSAWLSAFLDGVNAASLALMAYVALLLGRAAVVDWLTTLLAVVSLVIVMRYKINTAWLVAAGGVIGYTAGLL